VAGSCGESDPAEHELKAPCEPDGKMHTPTVVGIGELLWDKLPAGARLGGATTNFAVCCARLGNRVSLISSIGDDPYGSAAIEILSDTQLDLSQIQTDKERSTGTVEVAFSSEGQPFYTISTGVAWDFIQPTPAMLDLAASANAVYFGTLSQRHPVSREAIRNFIEATPPDCVRVCDINLRLPFCSFEVLAWSMAHATVIKISDEELASVFALLQDVSSVVESIAAAPQEAAESLLESFPECSMVAVTLGSKGCLLATRDAVFTHPGFPIVLVDTVGAGDAFTAGITHAYLRHAPLPVIATVGNLCGSFVASQQGATPQLPAWLNQRISTLLGNKQADIWIAGRAAEVMREPS
jgi:fructokinase